MLECIEGIGVIPAIRVSSADDAIFASEAIFSAGIPVVEITMTTPGATGVISHLLRKQRDVIVGAGTVLDLETAEKCVEAGASFLTSTGLDPELVQFARENGVPVIPGAMTPTEVIIARRADAAFIKIFPCASLGGPAYIRALRGPFPDVRFVASGGVNQQTAGQYIRAGSNALGIGHDLLPSEAVRSRNIDWIHELARRFILMVKTARADNGENNTLA